MGMLIRTKYKIARRLGAPIFEKTQTQKFAQSESRKGTKTRTHRPGAKSEYAHQHNEKQKTRFTYIVGEKQFANYVKSAMANKANSVHSLFSLLETRLDNVTFRLGFAPTRSAARQLVSHGHLQVNGRKVDVPSYHLTEGAKISIRPGSREKKVFNGIVEKMAEKKLPSWLTFDAKTMTATVSGSPKMENEERFFDLGAVIEFYSR